MVANCVVIVWTMTKKMIGYMTVTVDRRIVHLWKSRQVQKVRENMTEQRKDEIERKVFYRYMDSIMQTLERCKDTHLAFQIGMEMGYLHRSLSEELSKEVEPQKRNCELQKGDCEPQEMSDKV